MLTFDYLGALGASLLFPILLVPKLGMVRSALLFGIINAGVALWSTYLFRDQLGATVRCCGPAASRCWPCWAREWLARRGSTQAADNNLYADEVIFARDTRYQRIVLTQWKDDVRLFLSSHLQFSSRDEYRYHEALVHPGLAALPGARRVLVLGGGDGLAVREILKYPDVETITLVDLDPEMTRLFSTHPYLVDAQPAFAHQCARARHQRRCVSAGCSRPAMRSISSWSIFPIRPITRWASSTPRRSTACWPSI